MGSCCCKKTSLNEYTLQQSELLRIKVKAYSDGKINRYNIIRHISYCMTQLISAKLRGSTKKGIVISIIKEFLDPTTFPEEVVDKLIDNFIDDIHLSFSKIFKKGRCC